MSLHQNRSAFRALPRGFGFVYMEIMRAMRGLERLLLGGILLALPAAAQTLEQVHPQPHRWGYLGVSLDPRWVVPSAERASQLEQQLRDDPENQQVRADLLNYYGHNNMRPALVDSICWLIEHHPESPILGLDIAAIFSYRMPASDAADFERVRALWASALNPARIDPEILHNAARFFEISDVDKSIEIAKQLLRLDPAGHAEAVAYFYGLVLSGRVGSAHRMDRLIASLPLFEDLIHSLDPQFLGSVATELINYGADTELHRKDADLSFVCLSAVQLIDRARQLDPQNSQWTDLLEGAKRLPCSPAPPSEVTGHPVPGPGQGIVWVVGALEATRLIRLVPPDLSPAQHAGVEGVVHCHVLIGADGHVVEAEALSGNAILIPPAIDAVKQYVYTPTHLNGEAVEVSTTVDVPFQAH